MAGAQGAALNKALMQAREHVAKIEAELDLQRRENEDMKQAAEQEIAETLTHVQQLQASVDEAQQLLVLARSEVEDEALARYRAEETLNSMRTALLAHQQQQAGSSGVALAALEQERRELEAALERALAEAREASWARLDLEQEISRMQEEARNNKSHLAAQVEMLEAQVAEQRVREEEAMAREDAALARAEDAERREDAREIEARVREAVEEVKEEEAERRRELEKEIEELQGLVNFFKSPLHVKLAM